MINDNYTILTFEIKSFLSIESQRKQLASSTIFQTLISNKAIITAMTTKFPFLLQKVRFPQRLSEADAFMLSHHY